MLRKFLLSCKLSLQVKFKVKVKKWGSYGTYFHIDCVMAVKLIEIPQLLTIQLMSRPQNISPSRLLIRGSCPECKLVITQAFLFSGENSPPRICHLTTILCLLAIPAPSETSISPWVLTGMFPKDKISNSPVSPLNNDFSKALTLLSSPHISNSYNVQREKEIQQ